MFSVQASKTHQNINTRASKTRRCSPYRFQMQIYEYVIVLQFDLSRQKKLTHEDYANESKMESRKIDQRWQQFREKLWYSRHK